MGRLTTLVLCLGLIVVLAAPAPAATQQAIDASILKGLEWLASTQHSSGAWIDYPFGADGYVAHTASAALAFIEDGFLPGADVIIDTGGGAVNHGDVVGNAVNYLYDYAYDYRLTRDAGAPPGTVYWEAANFDLNRTTYTTGLCAPVIYALGHALGPDTAISSTNALLNGKSYKQVMQGVMDWFTYGQNADGGWRYFPNSGGSDNSTAQWGALPYLYGNAWGLSTPASVVSGLTNWTGWVQNSINGDWKDGGSGYSHPEEYVNMAKTGGMLLEFALMGLPITDARVQAALNYMDSMISFDHWNQGQINNLDQWIGGHLDNPYAMWAAFKALQVYDGLLTNDNGTPLDPTDDFLVGNTNLVSTPPGGLTIGQDWAPQISAAGDWYSHYCDFLVGLQNGNGSWDGYGYWTGSLATGWYINILNAAGVPPPREVIPEPGTMALLGIGLLGAGLAIRRRRRE